MRYLSVWLCAIVATVATDQAMARGGSASHQFLQRIEVLFGAKAVLFGAQALPTPDFLTTKCSGRFAASRRWLVSVSHSSQGSSASTEISSGPQGRPSFSQAYGDNSTT
jgi:hypothetical protein